MRNSFKVCLVVEVSAYNPEHAALLAEEPLKKALQNLEEQELEVQENGAGFHYVTVKQSAKKLDTKCSKL